MTNPDTTFAELGLLPALLQALDAAGYEAPTPIQARTIPPMLEGRDVLGQAQTGTGKTAAFALPLLSRLDLDRAEIQALVLAPTRELALQVAEAIRAYAAHLEGFHVLPVYGGTGFEGQLRSLRRGVHVVVGTPGRVMDHMRRGTLKLDALDTLVLDEADEMLRMGFIDDVKWVLEQAPPDRRIALFSATMPPVIRKIAAQHLTDPIEVRIADQKATPETVHQRYRVVPHHHKLDVLTRVLESEPFDGMLIFVRTRNGAVDLAEKLDARGVAVAALNGDVPQHRREQIVDQLKSGRIDVLVATDVAARGLDVDRLTHVVNYDPPHDTEGYVHRIGRTGRAGRKGEAFLFVSPRERHIVRAIERNTGQRLERLLLPTTDEVNLRRVERFKERVARTIGSDEASGYVEIVRELTADGHDPVDVAAAIAVIGQGDEPLLLDAPPRWEREAVEWQRRDRQQPAGRGAPRRGNVGKARPPGAARTGDRRPGNEPMQRYRVEVGHNDGVQPGNLVGAIAGESGLKGRFIGHIDIQADHATVELPPDMPEAILQRLQRAWVCGKELNMSREDGGGPSPGRGDKAGGAPPKRRGSKRPNPNKGYAKKGKKKRRRE